ncbi:hypothetical protein [Micromonospora sp. NPDC048830]|uniref:hypothetical protein n=1 Tax=Micromonospora sp. NPDC048830 TaxID=3364257 RepID=UPI003712F6F3
MVTKILGHVTDAFDDLVSAVSPPSNPLTFGDWSELERRLGSAVPADYVWLVRTYGAGTFDDYLHVLQPKSRFEALRLLSRASGMRELLERRSRSEGGNFPYSPEALLPVAVTEDADMVFWVKRLPEDPATWTITVNRARSAAWYPFDGGLVEFLASVYTGRLRLPLFPDYFPAESSEFRKPPSVEELRAVARDIGLA